MRALLLLLCALGAAAQTAPAAGDFGRRFLSNTRGVFTGDNVWPATMGVIAAGSSSLLDDPVQSYFGGERVAPALGDFGNILGNPVTVGGTSAILFWISYRGDNERFKAMSFDLTQAFVIDSMFAQALKFSVRRTRPDGDNHSFPSSHASNTTAAAAVIAHYYPKAAIPAYLAAAFTGFSRIEKNRHWLSDVVAGHAMGFILGRTIVRGHNPLQFGRVNWMPSVAPGGGVAVHASIDLSARR